MAIDERGNVAEAKHESLELRLGIVVASCACVVLQAAEVICRSYLPIIVHLLVRVVRDGFRAPRGLELGI